MGQVAELSVEESAETRGTQTTFRGSPDRVPGEAFRAMAELLLEGEVLRSRGELSRHLRRRLTRRGLSLHERTIRRHLSGEVATIPPEVEEAMVDLVIELTELESLEAIDQALADRGFEGLREVDRTPLVRSEEFIPIVQLWLHLNPDKSKRWLACRLQRDLRRRGLSFVVGSLESLLSGKGLVVRREILQQMLGYLRGHGIESFDEAQRAAEARSQAIERSLNGRELVESHRFQMLCRTWQFRHREASARRLSKLLRRRLDDRGIQMSINRLQKAIAGKTQQVRQVLIDVMEALLSEELPAGKTLDEAVEEVWSNREAVADLFWVEAEPIAALAREWLNQNPGETTRQLAIRISKTLERMGYSRGHNAIQPVLGGWKKKTRGFVYRAMLAQFDEQRRERIPEEHILEPPTRLNLALMEPMDDEDIEEPVNGEPSLDRYLEEMREHFPGALSPNFLAFAAYRAERLFGIPREEAAARIKGGRSHRTRRSSAA